MRQIGTVPDAHAARTFADYLTSLKIEARLDHQAQGWALWVFDEDRVQQAKAELEEFLRNPGDPRFTRAAAPPSRAPEPVNEAERDEPAQPPLDLSIVRRIVTVAMGAACVAVFVSSSFGDPAAPIVQAMQIAPDGDTSLEHVRRGELWRLVSPIFLHFGFLHLLFNVLVLFDLGRQMEQRRGPVRYLLLVLVVAVVSNLAQFYLGDAGWSLSGGFTFTPGGKFGGMSGVLYGLFGYIWVKSRWEPELGFVLAPGTVVLLVAWLFLCIFLGDLMGPVANVAHGVGLFIGLLVGYASHVLRAVRQR
jgi:GlpG protein